MKIEISAVPLETAGCLTIRRDDKGIRFILQSERDYAEVLFSLGESRRISATLATLLAGS